MNRTKAVSVCLAVALAAGNIQPVWAENLAGVPTVQAEESVKQSVNNPVFNPQTDYTIWDYVYFGRYPQTKLTKADGLTEDVINATYNKNGDAIVGGQKIRRVQINQGAVNQNPRYRYYRWEPIKWKVLKSDGNQMLLLSDVTLTEFEEKDATGAGWSSSALRSFLNGYGNIENRAHLDYTGRGTNFIGSAFSAQEQAALQPITVPAYTIQAAGAVSESVEKADRIVIPSISDIGNTAYGFANAAAEDDTLQPSATRKTGCSEYADWEEYETPESYQMRLTDGAVAVETGSASHTAATSGRICPMIQIPLSSTEWTKDRPSNENAGISIEGAQITLSADSFVYDGTAKRPEVSVKLGEQTLDPTMDYVVSYEKDTTAGTGVVKVNGIGDYSGVCTANYTIQKASQTIQVPEKIEKTYTDAKFQLEAKLISGEGAFSYQTSNEAVASIDEKGIVTVKAPGTAELTVTAAETANFAAASVKVPLIVGKLNPDIETPATLTASLSKKELFWTPFLRVGEGTLTYKSENEQIATIDANGKITLHGAGTVRLTATVAESEFYRDQTVSTELTVTKGTQKISVDPEYKLKFDKGKEVPIKVEHTEGDGQITFQSENPDIAFVDANGNVIMNGIGETTITVVAKANQNYEEVSEKLHLVVDKMDQKLTCEKTQSVSLVKDQPAPIQFEQTIGTGDLTFTSSNPDVVSVSADNTLIMHKCGKTKIHVTAAENESYAKEEAEFDLTITKGNQTITVAAPVIGKSYGEKPFALGAVCKTGVLSYQSSNEKVVKVSKKGKVLIVGPGKAEITISTPQTDQYLAASQKVAISVVKGEQKLSILKDKTVGYKKDGQVLKNLKLLAGDGKIQLTSSNPKVAQVVKGKLYMRGCGTTAITIQASGTKLYKPLSVTLNLTVTKTDPQEVLKNPIEKPYGAKKFFIGISGKKKNVTYKSDNKKVATIDRNGLVTVKGYGTTKIRVVTKESDICKAADVTTTLTVVPRQIKKLTLSSKKKGTLDISWKQDKMAQGYVITYTDGKQKKTIAVRKNDVTSQTITGLQSGQKYEVTVRAYVKVDGKKLYGKPVTMKKTVYQKKTTKKKTVTPSKPSTQKK